MRGDLIHSGTPAQLRCSLESRLKLRVGISHTLHSIYIYIYTDTYTYMISYIYIYRYVVCVSGLGFRQVLAYITILSPTPFTLKA